MLPGKVKALCVVSHEKPFLSIQKGRCMHHYGDNFVFVVPEDHPLHTPEHPFCGDPTCPCSENTDALTELAQAIRDGLITPDDATRMLQGKTV
jgi:hypothetical protein